MHRSIPTPSPLNTTLAAAAPADGVQPIAKPPDSIYQSKQTQSSGAPAPLQVEGESGWDRAAVLLALGVVALQTHVLWLVAVESKPFKLFGSVPFASHAIVAGIGCALAAIFLFVLQDPKRRVWTPLLMAPCAPVVVSGTMLLTALGHGLPWEGDLGLGAIVSETIDIVALLAVGGALPGIALVAVEALFNRPPNPHA